MDIPLNNPFASTASDSYTLKEWEMTMICAEGAL